MNEASIAGIFILTLAVVLVFGATFLDWLKHHSSAATGIEVFAEDPTVDEDINAPSVEAIDLALSMADDPDAINWLLDKRIAAKRRVS